jgi:hypothetical protein
VSVLTTGSWSWHISYHSLVLIVKVEARRCMHMAEVDCTLDPGNGSGSREPRDHKHVAS